MSTLLRAGLLAAAVVCTLSPVAAGAAGPKLAIAPVKDDVGGAAARQLAAALCGVRECLPDALSGPKLDLAKARKLGAAGSLVASVWTEKKGKVLSAALFTTGATPVKTWKLPLGQDGRLGQVALDQLVKDVAAVLPVAAAPKPAPAVAAPAAARPPPPAPPPAAAPRPAPPAPPPVAAPSPSPSPSPVSPEAAAPRPTVVSTTPPGWTPAKPLGPQGPVPEHRAPRVLVEAGLAPNHRELRYADVGGAPVPLGVVSDQPAMPRLRVEVRPVEGLGGALYADFAYGNGISLTSGGRTFKATASRLEAGALWRLPVTRTFSLIPALAIQRETFEVGTSGGVQLAAFPDQRLLGLRAGADAELWLEKTRFTLLAGLGATWWQEAGELAGSADFFPGGSAWGLSAQAGVEIALWGPLSARLLGDYAMTRWSLDPGATYTSTWARQEVVGGRIMLRAGF